MREIPAKGWASLEAGNPVALGQLGLRCWGLSTSASSWSPASLSPKRELAMTLLGSNRTRLRLQPDHGRAEPALGPAGCVLPPGLLSSSCAPALHSHLHLGPHTPGRQGGRQLPPRLWLEGGRGPAASTRLLLFAPAEPLGWPEAPGASPGLCDRHPSYSGGRLKQEAGRRQHSLGSGVRGCPKQEGHWRWQVSPHVVSLALWDVSLGKLLLWMGD